MALSGLKDPVQLFIGDPADKCVFHMPGEGDVSQVKLPLAFAALVLLVGVAGAGGDFI